MLIGGDSDIDVQLDPFIGAQERAVALTDFNAGSTDAVVVVIFVIDESFEEALAFQMLVQEMTTAVSSALKAFADSVRDKLTEEAEAEWKKSRDAIIEKYIKLDAERYRQLCIAKEDDERARAFIGDLLELNSYVEYQIAMAQRYGNFEESGRWKMLWSVFNQTTWDDAGDVADGARRLADDPKWGIRLNLIWEQRRPVLLDDVLKELETPPEVSLRASDPFTAATRGLVNLVQVMRYGANGELSPYQTKDSFVSARLRDEVIMNPFFNLEESRMQAEMDWENGVDLGTLPGRNEAMLLIMLPLEFVGAAAESRAFLRIKKYNLGSSFGVFKVPDGTGGLVKRNLTRLDVDGAIWHYTRRPGGFVNPEIGSGAAGRIWGTKHAPTGWHEGNGI